MQVAHAVIDHSNFHHILFSQTVFIAALSYSAMPSVYSVAQFQQPPPSRLQSVLAHSISVKADGNLPYSDGVCKT
ncbi:hypothetical protein D0T90_08695 [Neisseria animalis]|uniref:Uncharacterized protein n=1 Tax=Neisseria animalis TaxID=492 RepID=A0A5P3MSH8_NEIAN|nr:hypothetical protein D0T90_08695 [Neisseria animalis]ROW33050.1 hypothetical protein CGZ60_02020 [Neisseria animalis]